MNIATIKHLRFGFSLFLMPIFLFALSQSEQIDRLSAFIVFVILHLLIYPSSNGYNSYMDRDTGSIGGLENPPEVTKSLFYVTLAFDILGLSLSILFLGLEVSLLLLLYIIASRSYSYRGIRLKKHPIIGFLTVFVFQGAGVYLISYLAISQEVILDVISKTNFWLALLISSCLIGAGYPLTQIYQHKQDIEDGVITLSYVLGARGTFFFSATVLSFAVVGLFFLFLDSRQLNYFYLFIIMTSPTVLYFYNWFKKTTAYLPAANYKNAMKMSAISSICLNSYFIILVFLTNIF
jgi:1,4-dihydroxy-2-naphthoate polyprenyltransferase